MPPCMWPAGWKQTFSGLRGSLPLKLSACLVNYSGEIGGKKPNTVTEKKKKATAKNQLRPTLNTYI